MYLDTKLRGCGLHANKLRGDLLRRKVTHQTSDRQRERRFDFRTLRNDEAASKLRKSLQCRNDGLVISPGDHEVMSVMSNRRADRATRHSQTFHEPHAEFPRVSVSFEDDDFRNVILRVGDHEAVANFRSKLKRLRDDTAFAHADDVHDVEVVLDLQLLDRRDLFNFGLDDGREVFKVRRCEDLVIPDDLTAILPDIFDLEIFVHDVLGED